MLGQCIHICTVLTLCVSCLSAQVIKLISQVIADFANGEISQAASLFDTELTLEQYTDKSFYKTASLIAASCRSAAVFSESPVEVKEAMYAYGKHLGLAFQVVDDILDFTQTSEQLGKPQVRVPAEHSCALHAAELRLRESICIVAFHAQPTGWPDALWHDWGKQGNCLALNRTFGASEHAKQVKHASIIHDMSIELV